MQKNSNQKEIASRLGWNEGMVEELGQNGVEFLLDMIERHEGAERRLRECELFSGNRDQTSSRVVR